MKRTLGVGAVVALALVVAALVWLQHSLDGVVARAVEQIGSELLGSRVCVERVRISLADGRASITGLEVGNPTEPELGFSGTPALELDEITVEIDLEALDTTAVRAGEAPIPLALVRVAGPMLSAEATTGGLNLERLRRNVRDAVPSQASQPQTEAGAPVRLRIARFVLERGQLRADSSQLGGEISQVELPAFALTELGGERGAAPAVLGEQVLDALLAQGIRAAAAGGVGGELDPLKERAREKLRGLFD